MPKETSSLLETLLTKIAGTQAGSGPSRRFWSDYPVRTKLRPKTICISQSGFRAGIVLRRTVRQLNQRSRKSNPQTIVLGFVLAA
jgi:hypothetical protein